MSKKLWLGSRLRYPITIDKIVKKPGDGIKKQERAVQYSFKWKKEVGDPIRGDTWQEEQTTFADWCSPTDGTVKEFLIREGMLIERDCPCMLVEEACSHEVQFQGMCGICGKDMTEVNWASEQSDLTRATINMTHDQTSLMVSEGLAKKAEFESQRRLLRQKKLSLVVDLDQTIIHACIEPTIGEWQSDPTSPNHEAVKEVKAFQLNDDGPRGLASGCWYYIKMRPGLAEFLEKVSKLYELHVYTMGTRAYALNIAKIVDPDQKLFGNRVISRDENGSMISKSLQRLFPVSTNMVVIIDDRADVWPRNRQNLIKVAPYDFFKGIGDINSSFLPKRQDVLPRSEATNGAKPSTNGADAKKGKQEDESKVSALEELVSMSSGENRALQQKQTQEQERSLEKQIMERPLLHMQEALDKVDEQDKTTQEAENGDATPSQQRQQVLQDDDDELPYLQQHLTGLHAEFFRQYDETMRRLGKTNPSAGTADRNIDLGLVPDIGACLAAMKGSVLSGSVIVLSGLVPLGVDVLLSDIGVQTISLGASLHKTVTRLTTHLVISTSRPRTAKVQQAAKLPKVKIVNQDWLLGCISQWKHLDETPYLVRVHPADRKGGETPDASVSGSVSGSGDEDEREDLAIDTDRVVPDDYDDGEMSPLDDLKTFNWGECDDELKEFMGSDDEDEEDEDEDEEADHGSSEYDPDAESQRPEPEEETEQSRVARRSSPAPGSKRKAEDDEPEESEKRTRVAETLDDDGGDDLEADLIAELEAESGR